MTAPREAGDNVEEDEGAEPSSIALSGQMNAQPLPRACNQESEPSLRVQSVQGNCAKDVSSTRRASIMGTGTAPLKRSPFVILTSSTSSDLAVRLSIGMSKVERLPAKDL